MHYYCIDIEQQPNIILMEFQCKDKTKQINI